MEGAALGNCCQSSQALSASNRSGTMVSRCIAAGFGHASATPSKRRKTAAQTASADWSERISDSQVGEEEPINCLVLPPDRGRS